MVSLYILSSKSTSSIILANTDGPKYTHKCEQHLNNKSMEVCVEATRTKSTKKICNNDSVVGVYVLARRQSLVCNSFSIRLYGTLVDFSMFLLRSENDVLTFFVRGETFVRSAPIAFHEPDEVNGCWV